MKEKTAKKQKKLWGIVAVLILFNVVVIFQIHQKNEKIKAYKEQFTPREFSTEVPEIEIFLPETVYVTEGMTLEIYNDQVTSLGDEISRYNVRWNCEAGQNLERKFSVVAEGSMEEAYELKMEIYDHELTLIAEAATTLKVVKADTALLERAKVVETFSMVPETCLSQVKICVDTQYNGSLDNLKPEGVLQMQDVVYAVLCGISEK